MTTTGGDRTIVLPVEILVPPGHVAELRRFACNTAIARTEVTWTNPKPYPGDAA